MSTLGNSPPSFQAQPPPRNRNDVLVTTTAGPESREGTGKGSLRRASFSLPSPPVSGKKDDHIRLPAKFSNQQPQPQPEPDDESLERRYFMEEQRWCNRYADVASARKESRLLRERNELMPVVEGKGNREAISTEERSHLPTPLEGDQLPSSLIDRAWFGVEPEGTPTEARTSILNETPRRAQWLQFRIARAVNRISTGSDKTRDSGYESASNVSHDQTQELLTTTALRETKPRSRNTSQSRKESILGQNSASEIQSGPIEGPPDDSPRPQIQYPCADLDNSSSPTAASDSSSLEKETPGDTATYYTASMEVFPETPETPACSSVEDGEAEMESDSDNGASPRSPSPWQEADDEDTRMRMAIALSQITSGMSEMLSSHGSTDISRTSTRTASPETAPVDGSRAHAGSSEASQSNTSPEATNSSERPITDSCIRGVRRTHRRNDSNRGSDDGDGNEPNPKRRKPGTPEQTVTRRRFACPYQKYDPIGSPFCCAKTAKNQEGGAETFSRVKSHVLRNHDPFIRCDICWKTCRTEEGVVEHKEKEDCIPRASPAKYWMTREQRDQVQQRRFMSGHVENWFSLFGILCPNVPADGPNGYKLKISPYFMDTNQNFALPLCSLWPSHQPAFSGPEQDSYPTQPRTRPSPNSNIPFPFLGHGQHMEEATIDFSSLLNIPEADLTMDEPLPFDGTNIISKGATYPSFDCLLSNSSQPELLPESTAAPLSDGPMSPPDPGRPSIKAGGTTANPSSDFLQLDNARLRNTANQLRDEVQSIGKQYGEVQAQLRGFRNELRQLENSVEELLYQPSVQKGDREVMGRLFEISNTVTGMSKSLGSRA